MKRIAIFCDGTWNKMSARYPTNVLLAAQCLKFRSLNGVQQIRFYDEGVGTSHNVNEWIETRLAGAFGWGLLNKIEAAYRFLIFNYEPGDEIYIFGFSRGAFTARSLAGLIRKCGVVRPEDSGQVREIFAFYKDRDTHPDSDEAQAFRQKHCPHVVLKEGDRNWRKSHGESEAGVADLPLLKVRYLGVWDTVGALGVPKHMLISAFGGEKYQFHDTALSSTVGAARHAVAVDERRRSFEPALWSNLDLLNDAFEEPKYHQCWFPGDHGSIGGGGDIVGLSSFAFLWIVRGAIEAGLEFDEGQLEAINDVVDHMAPLRNQTKLPSLMDRIYRRSDRVGPQQVASLSASTIARLNYEAKSDGWSPYRPRTLQRLWPR